jgi:biopolymer transport protein ExbB
VDSGAYFIEIAYRVSGNIRENALIPILVTNGIIDLEPATLSRPAVVSGYVNNMQQLEKAFVRIYGLERKADAHAVSGYFEFNDIPAGILDFHVNSPKADSAADIRNVELGPADTVSLGVIELASPFAEWAHRARIELYTTAEGAGVVGDVYNFPLLVRLNSGNFNFTLARPDGSDLRFAKPDGEPLAHEAERWDYIHGEAEIWVKVDSVYGNHDQQYFLMYWGNEEAVAKSNAGAVFDTADGFRGVWHLGEEGNNDADNYRDATYHEAHGQGVSMSTDSDVASVIGKGQVFDGAEDYIIISQEPVFDLTTAMHISAWIRVENFDLTHQTIACKGGNAWRVSRAGDADPLHAALSTSTQPDFLSLNGQTGVNDGDWHLADFTWDTRELCIWVDGEMDMCIPAHDSIQAIATNDHEVWIGNNPSVDRFWEGAIDELRISAEVRPSEWIQLSYENQRADQLLVRVVRH